MLSNVGLYSYLTAAVTYAVLSLLLFASTRGRQFGTVLTLGVVPALYAVLFRVKAG